MSPLLISMLGGAGLQALTYPERVAMANRQNRLAAAAARYGGTRMKPTDRPDIVGDMLSGAYMGAVLGRQIPSSLDPNKATIDERKADRDQEPGFWERLWSDIFEEPINPDSFRRRLTEPEQFEYQPYGPVIQKPENVAPAVPQAVDFNQIQQQNLANQILPNPWTPGGY